MGITHCSADVWQIATWSFAYTGTSNLWDVDMSFTNLATSATTSNTFNDLALAVTTSDVFTEVTPRGQALGSMYVDNIQVSAVPEPTTALLLTLGLAGLGISPPALDASKYILSRSVGRGARIELNPAIDAACSEMLQRLDAVARLGQTPSNPIPMK